MTETCQVQFPKWLNEDFFENVLKESEKDPSIKITAMKLTSTAVNNDHYNSEMCRSKIEYTSNSNKKAKISLVTKIMPEMDTTKMELINGVEENFIFRTEIRMYSETIPKMEEVLRKYGDDTVLGARVLYTSLKPHRVIVFEDLVERGYVALECRKPTEVEIKAAILKLAKWHAVSYKLAQEEPKYITNYNDGIYSWDLEKIDIIANGIQNFINGVLSKDEDLKQYIPYFQEFDKKILKLLSNTSNAHKRGDKAIMVLNHGDFHFKNMMYKRKENGDLEDIMLVDFQACYYGPAVSDITWSMFMLWDPDMRVNRRDEMLHYYFSNFVDSLKKYEFKGEIPKMADFQIDLINYRGLEVYLLACNMAYYIALTDDSVSLSKIIESTEERMRVYLMPKVLSELKQLIPRYVQRGALEL